MLRRILELVTPPREENRVLIAFDRLIMLDQVIANWLRARRYQSLRTRRCATGALILAPLVIGGAALGAHEAAGTDSGITACRAILTDSPSAYNLLELRAEFAHSRVADVRAAGIAFIEMDMELQVARGAERYSSVWYYQRLSAACARASR